jgi:hypothetical protein
VQAEALTQPMTPARVAGPGSPSGVIEVGCLSITFLEMDELLRIARITQSVTPVTVIHSTASAQSRVATLHLIVHELLAFLVVPSGTSRIQSHIAKMLAALSLHTRATLSTVSRVRQANFGPK